jgi:hypothetical protein
VFADASHKIEAARIYNYFPIQNVTYSNNQLVTNIRYKWGTKNVANGIYL